MAESTVALKRPRLVTEDLGAACTHPGDIILPVALGRATPLAMGLLQQQRARAVSEKLPSVPVLPGQPHLGSPPACSCCQIQLSWKQEADLAQPLVGPHGAPRWGSWPHNGAARRESGPGWGFPKKGLNSSVEFATSLTTPFPVRGCVQPLFFSLSLFFSPPPPCPQSRRSWRCRVPPELAGVTLAGTMARLQVWTHHKSCSHPPQSSQHPQHRVGGHIKGQHRLCWECPWTEVGADSCPMLQNWGSLLCPG